MNEYYTGRRSFTDTKVVIIYILGIILGGMIGFGLGYYNGPVRYRTVINTRVIHDLKVQKITSISCKVIDYRAGDYHPYSVIQCNDGTIKVIR